ncbi:unnamed protein product [Phytophthora fragariaefolia]|uniref:Unnamed protein product n=1 Tax=Phytophthora fragariaefolia TaxID=1490495 RepID=A0A9W6XQ67_9STRA|nr:unnamed protein product [Phytophthora fragariaefolia]
MAPRNDSPDAAATLTRAVAAPPVAAVQPAHVNGRIRVEARSQPPKMPPPSPDIDFEEAVSESESFEVADSTQDQEDETTASVVKKLNSALGKCRKRKASSQSIGYSAVSEDFME